MSHLILANWIRDVNAPCWTEMQQQQDEQHKSCMPCNLNRIVGFNNRLLFRLSESMHDMKGKREKEIPFLLLLVMLLLLCVSFPPASAPSTYYHSHVQLNWSVGLFSLHLHHRRRRVHVDAISICLNIHLKDALWMLELLFFPFLSS